MGEQKTRGNVDEKVARPEHFNTDVSERTEHDVGGYTDYPSVEEEQSYTELVDMSDESEQKPFRVDIGQHIPQNDTQDWAVARHLIQEDHVRVAGRENNRTRLFLKNNDSANSVFIGKGQTDSTFTMYELGPGEHLELWHQSSVWAVCESGETAYLSIANEFVPHEDVSG